MADNREFESDVEAEFAFGALANVDDLECARNIDGDGLFKVDMLPAATAASRCIG